MRKKSNHSSSAKGVNGSHDVATLAAEKPNGKSNGKANGKKKKVEVYPRIEASPYELSGMLDNRELLRVLTEVKSGNFTTRMPFDQVGLSGKICDTLNDIISLNEKMMQEFTRAGQIIGKQGKLNTRIEVPAAKGSWGKVVESINLII
jgi:hypothetical protein